LEFDGLTLEQKAAGDQAMTESITFPGKGPFGLGGDRLLERSAANVS